MSIKYRDLIGAELRSQPILAGGDGELDGLQCSRQAPLLTDGIFDGKL